MSMHKHAWDTVDPYDGGLHVCSKCKRSEQGSRPVANDYPVSDAEQNAAAWLGPAGLYRTLLDAVQNREQLVEPVSADQLVRYARALVQMQIAASNGHEGDLP